MSNREAEQERVVAEFLDRYANDLASGLHVPEKEYLRLFPGHEDVIEEQLVRLAEQDVSAELERVGPYEPLRELGRGPSSTVYLARDSRSDARVALKCLHRGVAADGCALARFDREVRLLAEFRHGGVCRFIEAGNWRGTPFLAMEYVEGMTFATHWRRRSMDAEQVTTALRTIAKLADTVHALHRAGVVHRDIKPANVILRPDGQPVLVDFGVAAEIARPDSVVTHSGTALGTPTYMSPEQVRGEPCGPATDLWALGVLAYEAAAGRPPFHGQTRQELFRAILNEAPPTLDHASDNRLRHLNSIVRTALAKAGSDRYESVSAFAADLERVASGGPPTYRRPGAAYRSRRWLRQHPAVVSSTFVGIAIMALVIAWCSYSELRAIERSETMLRDERKQELSILRWHADLNRFAERVRSGPPAFPGHATKWQQLVNDGVEIWERGKLLARQLEDLRRRATHEELQERSEIRERILHWQQISDWYESVSDQAKHALGPKRQIADMEQIRFRTRYRFATNRTQAVHDRLAQLVQDHAQLAQTGGVLWLAKQQLAVAERRSTHNRSEAHARVARELGDDPRFAELDWRPHPALVPLGRNPDTGLQEFWHPRSGTRPQSPSLNHHFSINGSTGIVFVLLPGGRARVGSQHSDPDAARFDNGSGANELPIRDFQIAPFLLSKYELTQGQWLRLSGGANPSFHAPSTDEVTGYQLTLANPVENISWHDCVRILRRDGMTLPTELAWEYAARAGTETPWSTGAELAELVAHANVADQTYATILGGGAPRGCAPFDDRNVAHRPVSGGRPNPWGFHDVHGNVFEWCRCGYVADWRANLTLPHGYRPPRNQGGPRVIRGGCWAEQPRTARSSYRYFADPAQPSWLIGVRPMLELSRVGEAR